MSSVIDNEGRNKDTKVEVVLNSKSTYVKTMKEKIFVFDELKKL